MRPSTLAAALVFCSVLGCAPPVGDLPLVGDDPIDTPLTGATADQLAAFHAGDAIFDRVFTPADGLGPLYIRSSCGSCHAEAGRGPGVVVKMTAPPGSGPDALPYGPSERPYLAAGATTPLLAPDGGFGGGPVSLTVRTAPALWGRGYLEAVAESELLRVEQEQAARGDEIHGQVSRVVFRSEANPDQTYDAYTPGQSGIVGRFGVKARQPTLDDFTADAFQGDMGLTSALRPHEPLNPDGLTDDLLAGTDLTAEVVNQVAQYVRLLEIPARDPVLATDAARALFEQTRCSVCHVPTLATASDYPIPQLAGIDAPVFTDLLLHDLGESNADGVLDEAASRSQFRTAPLIGLRFLRTYLHDGRTRSLDEAIRQHAGTGSEANGSIDLYLALSEQDRSTLLAYVGSL